MTLDDIVDAVTDELKARGVTGKNFDEDMLQDLLDNYREVDDLPTFYRVSLLIKANFNL